MYQFLLLLLTLLFAPFALPQSVGEAVNANAGTVRLVLRDEPPTLNSMKATDRISSFVLLHTNEGLTRYDQLDRLAPGVAERWEIDDHGARFWLRRDSRWENGAAVTAADFVFAWREVLRPATASRYATLLYPIKNAEQVNKGELDAAMLGVRAVNDFELAVEFAKPCVYFPQLAAFMTMLPVNEAFYRKQGPRYAADVGGILANGPFRLSSWVHGASLRLEVNPQWYALDSLRLKAIEVPYMTSDARAQMNLFREGSIALADVAEESLNEVLAERRRLRKFADGNLAFLRFNMRSGRITTNHDLRRAVQAAIDNQRLANRVVRLPGARATNSLFPSVVRGQHGSINDEYPVEAPPRGLDVARQRLDRVPAALREKLRHPGIALLVQDSPQALRVAEYLQATLMAQLEIKVRIDRQTFKQRLQKAVAGEFDIELAGWLPDFDDPITYGDLFASWNPNNRGRYASSQYDHWVTVAQSTTDQTRRLQAMDRLQSLIIEDVPIIPLYETAILYVQHPRVKGVVRSLFGADPNLRYAWIDPP